MVCVFVVVDFFVCFFGCWDIMCIKDDVIWLRLLEKLFDGFEVLVRIERGGEWEIFRMDGWRMLFIMLEEMLVVIMVLVMDVIFVDFFLWWFWDFWLFYNIMIFEW